jgi:hypothetical protein
MPAEPAITYEGYKNWRKKNPSIFTTIVDKSNNLIGFFDIFPITHDAGEAIISGKLTERSLSEKHLLPLSANASATHIHIATILLNPRQHSFSPVVAKEVMLLRLKRFLERVYSPIETRTYTAFGQTKSGEALLKRCDFSMTGFSGDMINLCHFTCFGRPPRTAPPLAVCGKTGKFEVLPFRCGALCWWFRRLARHNRLFLLSLRSSPMRQPISGCGSGCRR